MAEDRDSTLRQARLAENEIKARAENERRSAWFHGHERVAFVCECWDPDCSDLISLDCHAYSRIRSKSIHFAVAPGHDAPEAERVVERDEGHWVTEKIGVGADLARSDATSDAR